MNRIQAAQSRPWYRIYLKPISVMYWGVHVAALVGIVVLGLSWAGLAWALGMYFLRMFLVTSVYHRYLSHRTFKTSRPMQFLLCLATATTVQKGPLWWAHHHRHHHRRSDKDDDLHSPRQGGFWWSHMGWFLATDFEPTDYDKIKDFARYPELRWLNRYWLLVVVAFAVSLFFIGGATALMWGFFVSTVLLWHGTFTVNSLAHVIGKQRYDSGDDSRNHWLIALITMGEGWHNNHHHYQSSCRQGFRWYEIDTSYYILRLLAAVRLIWDIREPPRYVVDNLPRPTHQKAPSTDDQSVADAAPEATVLAHPSVAPAEQV